MKNKLLAVLTVIVLLMSMMPFLALASTVDIRWARTSPIIDGTLMPGEWDLYFWFSDGDEPPMKGYIANDDQYLYLAFNVTDSTPSGSRDIFYVYIDIPPTGSFNEPKDAFGFGWVYTTTWTTAYTWFEKTTNAYPWDVARRTGTMPTGVEIVANMQSNARYYEMKIPLSVIETSPGDIIGLKIFARNTGTGGPSTDTINWYPNLPEGITSVYPEARVAVEGNYEHMRLAEHPPDVLWVDDDWAGWPPGTEVEPGKFIGYNAFAKIQDAIDIGNAGTTIYVREGVYHENLAVNKPLSILAASHPIIDGGAAGDCISISADNVVISGFEIRNGYNGISGRTSGSTLSYNIIHDNLNIPGYAGVGILLWGDNDDNVITENTIYNNDRQGIFIGYSDTTKLSTGNIVSHNTIYGNGLYRYTNGPDASAYGVQLWCADNNTIQYNEIYGHDNWFPYPDFDFAQGIYLCASFNNVVKNNNLHDNNYGVGAWSAGRTPEGSNQINYNNIAGNTGFGVRTFDTVIIDARFNWWGDASGPTHPSNSGGTGDKISDNIDYSPWLGCQFEIMPRIYHVNPTGAPGAIQEAIDEASPYDIIIVHEGTYVEQLIINKDLILQGMVGAKIVAPDTRSTFTIPESSTILDPIIFAYGSLTGSETSSVTIDGFEIDGGNKASSSYRYVGILCRNIKPGTISGNTLHSLYPPSGKGSGPQTFGILVYGDSDVAIKENEIKDFSRGGIGVIGDAGPSVDPSAVIEENIVYGNGLESETGWWAENGIQVGLGATGHIEGNHVYNCTVNNPSWSAAGILVVDTSNVMVENNHVEGCDVGIGAVDFPSVYGSPWNFHILSNVIITSNTLVSNTWQIDISNDARNITVTYNNIINATEDGIDVWSYFGDVYPTDVEIHYNNIEGSGSYGIWASEELEAAPVNATFNWWGHPTGPYHGTSWIYMGEPYGPHYGLGDKVSDYVLYVSWLQVVHDVAVTDVAVSPTSVVAGETVTINVTVENQGTDFENFTVTVYYDDTAIASQEIISLFPNRNVTITFYWNTNGVLRGTYTIRAVVGTVPGETDIEDNIFTDGAVEVLWHDVAVIEVVPSRSWVYQGHSVNISVTVLNKGDFDETVTVTLYYNITASQVMGVQTVTLLQGENTTLVFIWETAEVEYCHNYSIVAVATIVTPDNNPLDNIMTDGEIKIRILGDVNGDGTVDMADISIMIGAFLTHPGHPLWNPDLDLCLDDSMDMADICIAISNFLLTCQ